MNYINKLKVFILLIIVGVLTSCSDDFLNVDPTDSIPSDKVFDSYVTAESAMVGAYDQLSAYVLEGLWVPLMSDIMGEDVMINSVENWNWFVTVYQLNLLPNYSYTESPWWSGYKVIFDANSIVANANRIPDATQDQKDNLIGQGKALRAFTMLKLAQLYAPAYHLDPEAPSILNVTVPVDADAEDFPRATQKEVYNQIVSDLLSAIELLEDKVDKGFFDKRAAQAVLARAYLDMHEWEKAGEMARAAYEGLDLMSVNDMYGGFFRRNSETIFTVAYTPEDNNVYMSIPSFYWPVGGYSSVRANNTFVNRFDAGDARKVFFLKEPQIDEDRYLILKFAHNNAVGNAERISIRASEMYLIDAECQAELGNYTEAREALHAIQERSIPGVEKSKKSGQELMDEIMLERRKELFGEGFRLSDIKRRNQDFKREGDHWAKFEFNGGDEDYYRFTFPIPQSEIDANTKIQDTDQNTGY